MKTPQDAMIRELDRILKVAKISPALRQAVMEIRASLTKGDYVHATELSSVKSFITGNMFPKDSANTNFNEDSAYNDKVLGTSVYGRLDNMHHDLAFVTGSMPSGMMVVSPTGIQTRQPARPKKSYTLRLIAKERQAIERYRKERAKERK